MKQDACMIAQEKLHPVCAQRIEGTPPPTCLSLAEVCRESKECRFVHTHTTYRKMCVRRTIITKVQCLCLLIGHVWNITSNLVLWIALLKNVQVHHLNAGWQCLES